MARNKVLVRKRGGHSADNMLKALKLHRSGESIRNAAKICNISYPTLRRYVAQHSGVNLEDLVEKKLVPNYENHLVFTPEQENVFKDYIKECALKFYGLTTKDCRKVAYQMAKINNVTIPDCWERDQMAGREWLRSFKKRHLDLSVKKPEACSLARATSFNRETVKTFFDNLKTAMSRHPSFSTGCRLYNLDETATTTVQRPSKVMGPKGKHNIAKVTSGEKGILVTTCAIICASGQALPPALVFPRKNFKDIMLTGAPPGTLGLAHPSGWMTSELFVDVMKHFIKHSAASPDNPALLILDNHESHLSIEALDLAKKSGVTILTLHPHTTAKMQPLDVGLNAPFKVYYNSAIDSWMMRNPGKPMTIYNIAECVGVAYARAMTPMNIFAAFKKCGIFPFDPEIFTDIDFMPSEVTDRPEPQVQNQNLDPNIQNLDIESDETFCDDREDSPSILNNDTVMETSVTNEVTESVLKMIPQIGHHSSPVPGPSSASFVSPKQFMPPLKAGPRSSNRKLRKPGKSRIATDTPEKNEILASKKMRKETKVKEVKRAVLSDKKVKINAPKKKKIAKVYRNESTSEEEELEMKSEVSETEISEIDESEDEKEMFVIRGNFEKLTRKPAEDDYVLVVFDTKNIKVYYVAKIIEIDKPNYGVSFMRLINKETMKFRMPLEPDLANIQIKDIKMILPPPKINGTQNRNSTFNFPIRVAPTINLR
uniref:SFRICE_011313 n=1 Tax=Spodoptera frugiperda TaxID=7108 RepID=A0A2H1VRL1_SPOFR